MNVSIKKNLFKLLGALVLLAPTAQAQNFAWDTAPASANFSGANWTSGTVNGTGTSTISSGDSLYFGASTSQLAPNNDESSFTFAGITFNSGAAAFTIGGNAFTLSAGITNNAASAQTISNNITLNANETVTTTSGNITLAGNISDGGGGHSLTHTGTSGEILTLSGSNSFTGGLVLNAGTLAITALTNLGGGNSITCGGSSTSIISAGQVQIPNTTTITVNTASGFQAKETTGATTNEVSAMITGVGNCSEGSPSASTGVVQFDNDANNYSGTFSAASGILQFTSVANPSSASSLGAGTTAYSIGNGNSAFTFSYIGANNTSTTRAIAWTTTGTGGLLLNNIGSGTVQYLSPTALKTAASGANTLTFEGTNTGANKLAQPINNGTTGGVTTLVKSGAGTWILSGANTYTGTTTVSSSGGILQFAQEVSLYDDTTASWTAANIIVSSGGTLALNVGGTGEFTASDVQIISGLGTSSTTGFKTGSFLGLDTTDAGGSFTYGNVIANPNSGANSMGLAKLGTGALALTAANTYSGGTSIANGVLLLSNAMAAQSNTITVSINNSLTFGTGIGTFTIGELAGAGSFALNDTGGSAVTLQVGNQNVSTSYSGSLSGNGALTKIGNGTFTPGGVNSYAGNTTVTGGTLKMGASSIMPNGVGFGNLIVNSPGIFDLAGRSETVNGLAGTGTIDVSGGTAGTSYTLTIEPASGSSNAFSGVVQNTLGSGYVALTVTSNLNTAGGTESLTGVNTFNGNVKVNAGALWINNSSALGTVAKTITIQDGTDAELHLNGASANIVLPSALSFSTANQAGSGAIVNEAGNNTINGAFTMLTSGGGTLVTVNAGTLTLAGNATLAATAGSRGFILAGASNGTVSGMMSDNVATDPGNSFTLNKQGSGTWTLTAANSYSGTTTVSAGILDGNVSGSISGTNVTVTGGTLQLDTASVLSSSVTLNLAASPAAGAVNLNFSGTQTIGALNFGSASMAAGTWGAVGSVATHQNAAFTNSGILNVTSGGTNQTINFPNPGTQTYGVTPITLTATASSGLPVTYTVISGPASVAGSQLTITGASSVTVQADQAGNNTYNPAAPVSVTFTVNTAMLSITANTQSKTYGTALTFSSGSTNFSSSGLQNSDTIGSVTLACSGGPANTPIGSYTITPSAATGGTFGSTNYNITYVTNTLTVNPLPVVLTGTRPYDGTSNVLAAILTISNNLDGPNLGITGSGILASASVGGPYAITDFGSLTLTGTAATNYTLTGSSSAVTITLAVPTVTCPSDISDTNASGECGNTESFDATTNDTGGPTALTYTIPGPTTITSPYFFPVGTTTVTATVTNAAGTNSCTFNVIISDTTPPVPGPFSLGAVDTMTASVPIAKLLILASETSPPGVTLTITNPTATFGTVGISGGMLTYLPTGNYVGPDTINYTLSDGCGTATGTISVTVSANGPGSNGITITGTPGSANLQFFGIPGQAYYIQMSSPGATGPWTDVVQLTTDSTGMINYTVNSPPSPSFYRTSVNP